ncbi:hypothetical protein WJX73_000568 [Symbiochloris irregularis]|uniref:Uncharacterized protein n=1 Tax=Symbiochloris irregularis TaxID=706552 RepID=A0AAW1P4T7_9CHLO
MARQEEKEDNHRDKKEKKEKSHHKDKKEHHKDRSSRDQERHREKGSDHKEHRHRSSRDEPAQPSKVAADTADKSEREHRPSDGSKSHKRDRDGKLREQDAAKPPRDAVRDVPAEPAAASSKRDEGSSAAGGQQAAAQQFKVQDSGNESSMSFDETNRLRASLGLKPLSTSNKAAEESARHAEAEAKRAAERKHAEADKLAARVQAQKEKRIADEKLRSTKALGEADAEDPGDLLSWVSKSRKLEDERAKAERQAKLFQQQDADSDDDDSEGEGAGRKSAAELAGMRIRHGAEELQEGETLILTMADRNILDERGELDDDKDELENVLAAEHKRRDKARKDATNAGKPLFDEDGKPRGILDKYDESEEAEGMEIDALGSAQALASKQEEIRRKLAAAQERVLASQPATMNSKADFMTPEELASLSKPKRKKRKMRKKEADIGEDEDVKANMGGGLDIAALEAEAAAQATHDHGSRASMADRTARAEKARAEEKQRKQERYDRALEKANYASLALQSGDQGDDAEEDDDGGQGALNASLERARRAAQIRGAQGNNSAAEEALLRRDAAGGVGATLGSGPTGMSFTETGEFARGLQTVKADDEAPSTTAAARPDAKEEPDDDGMEMERSPSPAPLPPPTKRPGGWVSAANNGGQNGDVDEDMLEAMADAMVEAAKDIVDTKAPKDEAVSREKGIGGGLAGALNLLKERGELKANVEWAGRTNDMRADKLAQISDIFTGGRHDTRTAAAIEAALTRRDEFGRVMTPKEAFRELCYKFHGKDPSKNKKAKRIQKWEEEQRIKKAAASVQHATSSRDQAGKRSGSVLDVPGGRNIAHTAPTPILGGGDTPLVGDRKVAAMLGMPPPKPRKV